MDLREPAERDKHGAIPGSLSAPYGDLRHNLAAGGVLHALIRHSGRPLLLFCAFGERPAMAVQAAHDAGLSGVRHIEGGLRAWKAAAGPLTV